jgi:hypothetical protein
MASKYFCDGDCGTELMGRSTDIMIRREDDRSWTKHRLCAECAAKNVFLHRDKGSYVADSGFASDVLR